MTHLTTKTRFHRIVAIFLAVALLSSTLTTPAGIWGRRTVKAAEVPALETANFSQSRLPAKGVFSISMPTGSNVLATALSPVDSLPNELLPDNREMYLDVSALSQPDLAVFEPSSTAKPLSVSRAQSAYYFATETLSNALLITFTVTNHSTFDTVRNVILHDALTPNAVFISSIPWPDRNDFALTWNLGDVEPLSSVTATLQIQVPGIISGFIDLDEGALAYGTLKNRSVTASVAPATLAPDSFMDYLKATIDANFYDEYVLAKTGELGHDPIRIFEYVRSLGYESYKGSLRGAKGALWSKAGNSLDQASLLIAMLRASGIPSRYVHGTLSDSLAQELISSMFPAPQSVIGHVPANVETSDPVNDHDLLEETKDHYWVEMYQDEHGFLSIHRSSMPALDRPLPLPTTGLMNVLIMCGTR